MTVSCIVVAGASDRSAVPEELIPRVSKQVTLSLQRAAAFGRSVAVHRALRPQQQIVVARGCDPLLQACQRPHLQPHDAESSASAQAHRRAANYNTKQNIPTCATKSAAGMAAGYVRSPAAGPGRKRSSAAYSTHSRAQ